ncbi:MAG TPA: hypothetical protein VNE61_04225 [Ktedonobacteraceae bacterium]|nr:hypothetical protein [Ktedonobacteraceae bacterium]
MSTSLKDLKAFLEVLPCVCEEGRGHTKFILKVNSKVVAWTYYSRSWRSSTQIDDSTMSKIAKQMKCSNNILWKKLLAGQASKENYFRDLLEHGHITREEYQTLCEKENKK